MSIGSEQRPCGWREEAGRTALRQLIGAMRRNPPGWTARQSHAARWLQRSELKSSQAWRLKMGLRAAYAAAREHNSAERASAELSAWVSWARRRRLDPFKKLAATVRNHFDTVIREMLDHRSQAFVKAMNSLLQ